MTGRERMLCAINNQKPDRLPAQVHGWMEYYLKTYLGGKNQFEAYEYFDADLGIYAGPNYSYAEKDLINWEVKVADLGSDKNGNKIVTTKITTPKGELTKTTGSNQFTTWCTEYLIKDERDFEIWTNFVPLPEKVDWSSVDRAVDRVGDRGIVRTGLFDFGQGSPWQSFCTMFNTEKAIMACYDKPDWVHHALTCMLDKKLTVLERGGSIHGDLVETGGGAGSGTVIGPNLFKEFCLPYDRKQHKMMHELGAKTVYHLCGGIMDMLELVAETGTDGLETMTPASMGGDCDLAEAYRQVGHTLFFIGGFDQNAGFENGNPELVRDMVRNLHRCCPDGGYIVSPSDHFFFGDPANVRSFFDAAKNCRY